MIYNICICLIGMCLMPPCQGDFNLMPKYEMSVKKSAGIIYLGKYECIIVYSLKSIPESIRKQVQAHLLDRLGNNFYQKINFVRGEIINKEELLKIEPNVMNYRKNIPEYRLVFNFVSVDKGIESYDATIEIDSSGNIVKEIDLPNIVMDQNKINLITLHEATNIAAHHGFKREYSTINIKYNGDLDIIVWTVSRVIKDNGNEMDIENIDINAHTGNIVSIYITKGTR